MPPPLSADMAERAFARRFLRVRRDADRGMLSVTVELPIEAGELLDKALETVKRLCCDGQAVVMTETRDGEPLSIGR